MREWGDREVRRKEIVKRIERSLLQKYLQTLT
jgi:ribosomal protein S17E